MDSGIFKLNIKDLVNGIVVAIVSAVFISVYGLITSAGFDIFTADWAIIGSTALNAAIVGFVGYIGKKFFTTSDGKVLGLIG